MAVPSISLPSCRGASAKKHTLIYFICGNPGLIEYYRDFLTYLCALIDGSDPNSTTAYDIYGRSLPGFSDNDHAVPFSAENPPWGLDDVIEDTYKDVAAQRRSNGQQYDDVILLGHSVGTFISVEIFHRHLQEGGKRAPRLTLSHGLLLFPTVTHIALSPSGRIFTLLMNNVPFLDSHAHVLARMIMSLLPAVVILGYLRWVAGFADSAAQTTVQWLKSRDGVWQTFWLARDEMKMIAGEERWGEEIWQAEKLQEKKKQKKSESGTDSLPRFFMFYGKQDHWVANDVRDEFVQRMRSREKGEGTGISSAAAGKMPRLEIDEGCLPHAFSTREDSTIEVARKVSTWVAEIEKSKRML